ncbi:MAG: thioredoxin [Cytophagaceae bacterium]|jgi:thioredoxin|nr:thioredoxin [Cytophagaceae bacterium]
MKNYHLITATLFLLQSFSGFAGNPLNSTSAGSSKSASEQENKVIQLTQDDFIEKIFDFKNSKDWKYKGKKPAIIDFYAEWCGPCKMLAPILVELQNEYKEKIQIYKIDAEKNRELAAAFGVNAYPTIFFIPMEDKPAGAKGLLPKEKLEEIIETYLKVSKHNK